MLRLYDYLPSQNGYKVRQLLRHLGRDYQQEIVEIFQGASHTEDFLDKNPAGAVPALEPAPGEYLAESNAILFYLGRGTAYLPEDPLSQARVIQWFCFELDYVQSTIGSLRYWTLTGKLGRRAGEVPARRAGGERALARLERYLGQRPFLVEDRYTVADIALFAYTHLAGDAGFDLGAFPAVEAWIGRVRRQPGHLAEVHPYSIDPYSSGDL